MLQINTNRALIGINSTQGQMSIRQPKGDLEIHQTQTKIKIQTEHPKVIIDQYQCFAEAGLKNYMDLTRDNAQYAKQKAMESIARWVEDGNRMAMVEGTMPDAIPEIAEKNAWKAPVEVNMATIPKSRPKIEVRGALNIQWEPGGISMKYTSKQPKINYQSGKVEIYLRQKPRIEIKFVDEKG